MFDRSLAACDKRRSDRLPSAVRRCRWRTSCSRSRGKRRRAFQRSTSAQRRPVRLRPPFELVIYWGGRSSVLIQQLVNRLSISRVASSRNRRYAFNRANEESPARVRPQFVDGALAVPELLAGTRHIQPMRRLLSVVVDPALGLRIGRLNRERDGLTARPAAVLAGGVYHRNSSQALAPASPIVRA